MIPASKKRRPAKNKKTIKRNSYRTSPKKKKLRVTHHLGLYDCPDGGSYLFNQLRFLPLLSDAPKEEVADLINKIRKKGISFLPAKAVELFIHHGILVPEELHEPLYSEYSDSQWNKALATDPFIINMDGEPNNLDIVLQSFISTCEYIRKMSEGKSPIIVRIFSQTHLKSNSFELLDNVRRCTSSERSNNTARYLLEASLKDLTKETNCLLRYSQPCVCINCIMPNTLSDDAVLQVRELIKHDFYPHLIFYVSDRNRKQIYDFVSTISQKCVQDSISFDFRPIIPSGSNQDSDKNDNSLSSHNYLWLIDSCLSLGNINESQFFLYSSMIERIKDQRLTPYPCSACAGKEVYITPEGRYSNSQKNMNIPSEQYSDVHSAIQNPLSGMLGRSDYALKNCVKCPIRYQCGGMCSCAERDAATPAQQQNIDQLRCEAKRRMVLHKFKIMAESFSCQYQSQYRFESGKGRLEIVTAESK